MPDMSIVISDGRIVAIGRTDDVTFPKNARMVDATGKELAIDIERITHIPYPYFIPLVYSALDASLIRAANSYDSQKLAEVSKAFVKNGTWVSMGVIFRKKL